MPKGPVKVKRIMRRYGKKEEGTGSGPAHKYPGHYRPPGTAENSDNTGSISIEYSYLSSGTNSNLSEKGTKSE